MMAVAEARAAWQRTVNRCLVQEDAKRAPKLACCPSPLTQQDDVEPTRRVDSVDAPTLGPVPYTWNSSHSNVFPDSRWWLQFQPSCAYNSLCVESETDMSEHDKSSTSCDDEKCLFYDSDFRNLNCVNDDDEYGKQDLNPSYKQKFQDLAELGDAKDLFESAVMVPARSAILKKPDDFDSVSPWDMNEKTEPWWRTTDRDELALLVSKRSFGLVENCDLPQPQKTYDKGEAFADFACFERDDTHPPLKVPKYPAGNQACTVRDKGFAAPVDVPLQSFATNHLSSVKEAIPKRNSGETDNPGKAELLEALCHSQTRAREAEKAAKEANAEKEHIMKLVFRQASQLFAYKQWFQLLQLENLYNQIKHNNSQDVPISTLVPLMMPWPPQNTKPRKLEKNRQKGNRGKRVKTGHSSRGDGGCCLRNCAVAIALGLSLVGAGLLLGWTLGCFLPPF